MRIGRGLGLLLLGGIAVACFAAGAEVDAWTLATRSLLPIDANDTLFHWVDRQASISALERQAATRFIDYLDTRSSASVKEADALYGQIADDRVGTDWPALKWMCHYLALPPRERPQYLAASPDGARLVAWFEQTDFRQLRDPLILQYHLRQQFHTERLDVSMAGTVIEYLLFMNPARPAWEKTDAILDNLDVRAGDRVADIGCGPGYHTFRLARMVGPEGRVYAVETNALHLSFVAFTMAREHLSNIERVHTSPRDVGLPAASLDCAFICSLYHAIYGATDALSRDFFLGSVWRALKPGGRLIVVDNNGAVRGASPFIGERISAPVVVSNLLRYGFEHVRTSQPVPQRYVLVFRKPL